MASKLRNILVLLVVAIALCGVCSASNAGAGAVHRVGGSEGWVVPVNYNQWSSSEEFNVGDSLLFSYDEHLHNVVEVTEEGFKSCESTAPIAVYSSGSDTITLKRPGHYYFLCGAPSHCEYGQKVEVIVNLPTPETTVSSPSPAPSGLFSPLTPRSESPISSPSPAPSGLSFPSTPRPESRVSSPSPAPSVLSSPSIPRPEERPPHSAALTIDVPKLSLAFASVLVFSKLMF
ncbi:blue copper protein-like [Argentina anserina]|uniref:blue copper protein-like n=1 Tax=Argentina anserina TaxID=57926 RepID=UPI002176889C|nr:blue copper protein-like [Potentilla anserina]